MPKTWKSLYVCRLTLVKISTIPKNNVLDIVKWKFDVDHLWKFLKMPSKDVSWEWVARHGVFFVFNVQELVLDEAKKCHATLPTLDLLYSFLKLFCKIWASKVRVRLIWVFYGKQRQSHVLRQVSSSTQWFPQLFWLVVWPGFEVLATSRCHVQYSANWAMTS